LSSKKIVKSEIGNRIRSVRGPNAQKEFAKILGFSSSYLSEVESGKTKSSLELLIRISEITNCSLHWLLTGEGTMHLRSSESAVREDSVPYGERGDFVLVRPVGHEIRIGTGEKDTEKNTKEKYAFHREWLQSKGDLEDLLLFEVRGDSMEPTITDGDVVLMDSSRKQLVVGNIYALRIEKTVVVKRLQPVGARRIEVMSDNKLYDSYEIDLGKEDIEILGQVIWIGRELVK
jgi:phage repressor protein C with HTH and peptisase S24 domain